MGKVLTLKTTDGGWFGWFRGHRQQEDGLQNPFPYDQHRRQLSHSDERLSQLPLVYACGRILSETVASLPLRVIRRGGTVNQFDTTHWMAKLLERPNSTMTAIEFRQAMELYVCNWGNAYARITKNARGEPVALNILAPWNIEVCYDGREVEYHYSRDGVKRTDVFTQNEVFHLKGFGDGKVGFSTIGWLAQSIGQAVSASDYMATFLDNDCKQPGILSVDATLKPEQREKFARNYPQLTNASQQRLTVLEGNMKFSPNSISPADAQMIEARLFNAEEIAGAFGVPLHLVGHTQKTTSFGSGVEELNIRFLQYGIEPRLQRWEQGLKRWVLEQTSGGTQYCVEHDTTQLLRTDLKTQAEWISVVRQNGILDSDEIRERIGYSERNDPGSKTLHSQLNLAPIGELSNARNENPTP